MKTRVDGWSPQQCLAALIALCVALIASLAMTLGPGAIAPASSPARVEQSASGAPVGDAALYEKITSAVASGENYYEVAAREHRLNNFPLKPYFTVRPPVLAWLSAAAGPAGTTLAMYILIGAVAMTWLGVLRAVAAAPLVQYAIFALIAESLLIFRIYPISVFHESWAALLIAWSIALRRPGRYGPSIAAGLAAVLVRDIALPFLVLMAVTAAWEKSWREASCWGAVIGVALAVQVAHAMAVGAVVINSDLASQGWHGMGGWPLVLAAAKQTSALVLLPSWFAALAVPLSLFGWVVWQSQQGLRITGLMLGYMTALMLFARPDTFYWLLLIEPFLLAGLALAPSGLMALWTGCRLRQLVPDPTPSPVR
jgi:membrane-bound metal-dependent hydrolase YbcI (DUF457 family)